MAERPLVEVQGINELIADLTRAGVGAQLAAEKVVRRSAQRVKDDARRLAGGIAHAPHYPRSITYDVTTVGGSIGAEIGPDKNLPQGALGNILEYGTVKNAPLAHLGPALDVEGPNFEAALEAITRVL